MRWNGSIQINILNLVKQNANYRRNLKLSIQIKLLVKEIVEKEDKYTLNKKIELDQIKKKRVRVFLPKRKEEDIYCKLHSAFNIKEFDC